MLKKIFSDLYCIFYLEIFQQASRVPNSSNVHRKTHISRQKSNASIDNKEYGAIIANEWKIVSVPTIIMFEKGKEIRRFEAGLSFKLDADEIKRQINKEIDEILLRRFQ